MPTGNRLPSRCHRNPSNLSPRAAAFDFMNNMSIPQITNKQLLSLLRTYWQWRWLWLTTTVAFGALGLFYVLCIKSDTFVASQGILVRDEANGALMRLGRFESQTEMKAAQETILEMARNPQVVHGALTVVGREESFFGALSSDAPPSTGEVEDFARDCVEVRAPRGAELGTTEVIYLDIKDETKERAIELNKAVCIQLQRQLQQVRQARADGVIAELSTASDSARRFLEAATDRLKQIELETGADLSDLRSLTDAVSGSTSSRQLLDSIKAELRAAELQDQQLEINLKMANDSFNNPDELLLAPTSLLNDNPGLKKLREGLADASIRSSELRGRYTITHPLVASAMETEKRIRDQMRIELGAAVESLNRDRQITVARLTKLGKQKEQLESTLARLAAIRAEYSNISMEVAARNEQLQQAERDLTQALASREAALTSSLITLLDEPIVSENPLGPGRATILAGAIVSGLFFGLGIIFLLTPADSLAATGFGRRQGDSSSGRRLSDRGLPDGRTYEQTAALPPTPDRRNTASTDNQPVAPETPTAGPSPALTETLREIVAQTAAFLLPGKTPPASNSAEPTINATGTVIGQSSDSKKLGGTEAGIFDLAGLSQTALSEKTDAEPKSPSPAIPVAFVEVPKEEPAAAQSLPDGAETKDDADSRRKSSSVSRRIEPIVATTLDASMGSFASQAASIDAT